MKELLSTILYFNGDLIRNIVDTQPDFEVFADLINPSMAQIAQHAENCINRVKQRINYDQQLTEFYYTAAIAFPFEHDAMMASRYSDGSYPVWYGSKELETSIYETVYRFVSMLNTIEGIDIEKNKSITRHRLIYNVLCEGFLIDVHNKADAYPELIANDYHFCQKLGKIITDEGLTGILSPSARFKGGSNANIFKQSALKNSRFSHKLTYIYNYKYNTVKIIENNRLIKTIINN